MPTSTTRTQDGIGTRTAVHPFQEVDNCERTTIVRPSSLNKRDELADDDDDAALALINDIRKIRAMSSSILPMQSVPASTTKTEHQPQEGSSRPGSFAVSGYNSRQGSHMDDESTTGAEFPLEGRNNGDDSESIYDNNSVRTNNNDHNSGTHGDDSLLCVAQSITAAMVETEREMIYQQVMESVTANAVIADIVGIGDDADKTNEGTPSSPESRSNVDDDGTTTNESALLQKDKQLRRLRQCMCIALVAIFGVVTLVAIGVLVVVRRRGNSESVSGGLDPQTTVQTMVPTSAPTSVKRDDGVFYTTQELYNAVDAYLIALNTTSTPEMSDVALQYGYPMNTWNVSLLTNFTRVFDPSRYEPFDPYRGTHEYPKNMSPFNEDLSQWDVTNAETMFGMFVYASDFRGVGIDNWDTSNVQDMSFAFFHAYKFNNTDLGKWNTSRVTSLDGTFFGAAHFSGDVSKWDVSSVTNMANTFGYAFHFTGTNLGLWDVSNVQDMNGMFISAESFNGNISGWNTSQVLYMSDMFFGAYTFDADLSSWSVGNVLEMDFMFSKTSIGSGWDISNWDTSRVTSMNGIFSGAESFNGNVSSWDVSNVDEMYEAFSGCTRFNGDLSKWDTGRVGSMANMFMGAAMFAGDLSKWNTSKVVSMREMDLWMAWTGPFYALQAARILEFCVPGNMGDGDLMHALQNAWEVGYAKHLALERQARTCLHKLKHFPSSCESR